MSEKWLPVVGFEGRYEVSDQGRVASLPSRTWPSRRLLATVTRKRDGYIVASLWRDGRQVNRKVHQLVCEAFNGARPLGAITRHIDGNRTNNTPSNLAWGDASENGYDRVRHGTHPNASRDRCINSHLLDGPNLYINPASGQRVCRACASEARRRHESRKKASA